MAKYRVYEVAENLDVESSDLVRMLREMGISVRSHMSAIDEEQVARLHARLERKRRVSGDGADGSGTSSGGRRRRRRRRRPEPEEEAPAAEAGEPEEEAGEEAGEPEEEAPAVEAEEEMAAAPEEEAPGEPEEVEELRITGAAEELAEEHGIDPAAVEGTGAEGRVLKSDVEARIEELEEAVEAGEPEEEAPAVEAEEEVAAAPEEEAPGEPEEVEELRITGAAEELAEEHGIDPAAVEGTGAEGRILKSDVEARIEELEEAVEAEEAEEEKKRKKRKPKPVRRGMPRPGPAASAAPGGSVKIEEDYSKRGKGGGGRPKKPRIDKDAVEENVKKTLAEMEGGGGGRKGGGRKAAPSEEELEEQRRQEKEREKTRVRVNEFLSVAELADLIEESPQEIITSAFKNLGMMVTINQRLDFDQIELICEEFGYEAVEEEGFEADLQEDEDEDGEGETVPRAPVVTVMGHVDHGKTSLLDRIRKSNVVAGESGGITQHIGAYRVDIGDDRSITFLDTPGHEAFTAMRARGAEVTDVVVLVVAADDAVMPQTVEAISHARNAGVPMVVAINKMDLPSADASQVKQGLLNHEVVVEEFGGEVLASEVSAETGEGIDDLLEKIHLQSELLELEADPDRDARGTVVEAELDKGMGPVATVLVQSGTLDVGDDFICGLHGGRVRALLDERGNNVDSAGPSTPVRVLGLDGVPQAGDSLVVLEADRVQEIANRRQQLDREKDIRRRQSGTKLEDIFEEIQAGEKPVLNLVIKGDTHGSVQAVSDALEELSTDEVEVQVIHRGVGAVNESDVLLATTSDATIIGFHVRPDSQARSTAETEGVEIRNYNVIYEAVQDVRRALEGMLEPEEEEVIVGTAEVRQIFKISGVGTVAGCYVEEGEIRRNLPVRVLRDHVEVYDGEIESLKRFQEDVSEVREDYECGISIADFNDVKEGDLIESYRVEEVARTLEESAAASSS